MPPKKALPLLTTLIAVVSIYFWRSEPQASQANAVPLQQNTPIVAFNRASTSVIEPDSGETISITLDVLISDAPEHGEAAKVTYSTANGMAVAGVDYIATAGVLTFPAGSTDSQSFDIIIIGNNIHQPNRAFVAFLTNPVNTTVSVPAAVTIFIVDNDQRTQNFLPVIRGLIPGPTRTPIAPTKTPTPCPYC